MIKLDYKDGRSLNEQISAGIKALIVSGALAADEQLPSVRELSVSLTVNPNTVQRAYKQLENEGFVYSVKGRGSFVAAPFGARDEKRISELYGGLTTAVRELAYLGESKESIDNIVKNIFSEKEEQI